MTGGFMALTWAPALLLIAVIAAMVLMRGLPLRVRLATDALCVIAISGWLYWRRQYPVFEPVAGATDAAQVWLQVIEIAWWCLCARLVASFVRFFFGHARSSRESRLFSDLASAAIYIAAILTVLGFVLDLPIRGVLATSGILAIVLGLALQSTLSDVFAGIAVGVEKPFHVGDRIRLSEHIEGVVVQTNWRSIRIQTDEDDIAVVPNSQVAKAEIINRSSPTLRRGSKVEVLRSSRIPPEHVIELLHQAVLLSPDILETPKPSIALTTLGDKENTYTVRFAVADGKVGGAKSALLQQARRLFHHAGVLRTRREIPIPAHLTPSKPEQLLRELVLFEALTDEQVTALAAQLTVRVLEPGDILFNASDLDATLYVIAKGIVEISFPDEDKPAIGRIGPGEYIGEIGMLTGVPHPTNAQALTHCTAYLLTHEAIAPLMENPALAAALESSVRRGLELLHRDMAARTSTELGGVGELLGRIIGFFQKHASAARQKDLTH